MNAIPFTLPILLTVSSTKAQTQDSAYSPKRNRVQLTLSPDVNNSMNEWIN